MPALKHCKISGQPVPLYQDFAMERSIGFLESPTEFVPEDFVAKYVNGRTETWLTTARLYQYSQEYENPYEITLKLKDVTRVETQRKGSGWWLLNAAVNLALAGSLGLALYVYCLSKDIPFEWRYATIPVVFAVAGVAALGAFAVRHSKVWTYSDGVKSLQIVAPFDRHKAASDFVVLVDKQREQIPDSIKLSEPIARTAMT